MAEPEVKKSKLAESETPKKAIITGITGQDGSYLAEFLLEKVSLPRCRLAKINFDRNLVVCRLTLFCERSIVPQYLQLII